MDSSSRGNQYYYVDHWSLRNAAWCLLVGIIGLFPSGRVHFQPQARLRWLWLPTLVPLFLIWYPNMIAYRGHAFSEP